MFIICLFLITLTSQEEITIAFGSCFKFYRNHFTDVFQRIQSFNPQYFLWLGDAAYIDSMPIIGYWLPEYNDTRVKQKFDITNEDFYYKQFKKNTIIKGVYDDHDSNENNGGKFNPLKEKAKQLYLDFIGESQDSPLRKQDGIYQSFYVDKYNKILVVMTDARYNSDKYTGDSLGENQWKWLEQQLQRESELIILTSGVQVLHDDRAGPETWFPESKQRFYELIEKYNKPIIILSGDIHSSEILKHPCPQKLGQNLYEFTSSGLTFANYDHIPFVNIIFSFLFPTTFSNYTDHYYKSNFAILKIITDQNNNPIKINYETHSSEDSSIVLQKNIDIKELQKQQFNSDLTCILDVSPQERLFRNILLRVEENIILVSILTLILLLLIFVCLPMCINSYCKEYKRLKKVVEQNNRE